MPMFNTEVQKYNHPNVNNAIIELVIPLVDNG